MLSHRKPGLGWPRCVSMQGPGLGVCSALHGKDRGGRFNLELLG